MSPRQPRIAYLIKRVERGLRLQLDLALSRCGVTTPEYTVLSVLRERDGLSSAQLARRSFVTPQAMNLIVIELERRGLVKRRPSETHARAMLMSLTPEGVTCLSACDRVTLPVEEEFLAELTREEVATLRKTLQTCARSLFDRAASSERPGSTQRASKDPRGSVQDK